MLRAIVMTIGSPNHKYTFNTFVIGQANKFAHAAAIAVVDMPSKMYNPLYIYGTVGVGKTHLLHAIAQGVAESDPNLKIMFESLDSGSEFRNVLDQVREDVVRGFRERFGDVDVLLIDDIHSLPGKETVLNRLWNLVDYLCSTQIQVVLAGSASSMSEIRTHVGRYEWGMIADIQPYDLETRLAIIRKKAKLVNLDIPGNVAYFIATKIKSSDVRRLEGHWQDSSPTQR